MLTSGVVLFHKNVLLPLKHCWHISPGSLITLLTTPDLTPNNYQLFTYTKLKKWFKSLHFDNNELMEGVKM
jgi:hypothetical protein